MVDSSTLQSNYGFTKIVVDNLDRTANFYKTVFDYRELQRVQSSVAGELIEEIILVRGEDMGGEIPLVVWKWPGRAAPAASDVILGFITADADAVMARAVAAGGRVVEAPRNQPEHGVRVGFAADVDGRLLEIVQMLKG
jgi:predicted enzyme related to lactoylglutathione lyase